MKFYLGLLAIFLGLQTMSAQQYVWAQNQSSALVTTGGKWVTVFPNNSFAVSASANQSAGQLYVSGSGNGVAPDLGVKSSTGGNVNGRQAIFDTNLNLTNHIDAQYDMMVADPLNSNTVYTLSYVSLNPNTTGVNTVSGGGWSFTTSVSTSGTVGKNVLYLVKKNLTPTGSTIQWVRFMDCISNSPITSLGDFNLEATVVGGQTKIAVTHSVKGNAINAVLRLFSNGLTGVTGAINQDTHLMLRSNTVSTGGMYYAASQWSTDGTPEWLGTFTNTSSTTSAINTTRSGILRYDTTGNLFWMANTGASGGNSTSYSYNQFTNNSGTPIATTTFGANTTQNNYVIFKIQGSNGALLARNTSNMGANDGTTGLLGDISGFVCDGTNVFLIGTTLTTNTTVSGSSTLLSGTTNDLITIRFNGSDLTVNTAKRFTGGANEYSYYDDNYNSYGYSYATSKNYSAIDNSNGFIYIVFRTSATTSFSLDAATVQMPSGRTVSGILKINSSSLQATQCLNLVGTSPIALNNTNLEQRFNGIAVGPTGDLWMQLNVNHSAELRVNAATTALKSFLYYNGLQPLVGTNTDNHVAKLNASWTTANPQPTIGFYSRANNTIQHVVTRSNGNPVYAATLYGTLSWNGTALGGTAGSITAYGSGIFYEVDKTTGTVIRVKNSTPLLVSPSSIRKMVYLPNEDSYIVIHNSIIFPGQMAGNGPTVGKTNPMATNLLHIVKLNSNFDYVWGTPLDGTRDHSLSTAQIGASILDLSVDPLTGDIYFVGLSSAQAIYIKTTALGNVASYTFNNTWGSIGSDLTLIGYNRGEQTLNSHIELDVFVVKLNANGNYQWGKMVGSLGRDTPGSIQYLNGKVYLSLTSGSNMGVRIGSGANSGINGTTDFIANTNTNPHYILQLNASTGANIAVRDFFTTPNFQLGCLAADMNQNKLFVGGMAYGGSFGGVTNLAFGGFWDGIIFEIDPITMADRPTGAFRVGGNSNETISSMVLDLTGKLFYRSSSSSSSSFNSTNGTVVIPHNPSQGQNDFLVGGIDVADNFRPIFGYINGSINNDNLTAIAPGDIGSIFIGGELRGNAVFGNSSLISNTSGDFVSARLDYPFKGPGGIVPLLSTWFSADYSNNVFSGSNTTEITNRTNNISFQKIYGNGSPYHVTPGTVYSGASLNGINYFPYTLTKSAKYLDNPVVNSGLFTNSGRETFILGVVRPRNASSNIIKWSETGGSELSIRMNSTVRTGSSGSQSATHSSPAVVDKWQIFSVGVASTGSLSSFINGNAVGTLSGINDLNTLNNGVLQIGGLTTDTDVAEVMTFKFPYHTREAQFNQIHSYLSLKYGITHSRTIPYLNSSGVVMYDPRVGGTEAGFIFDIAGLIKDETTELTVKQAVSANNNLLTIGAGNQIAVTQNANTANLNNLSYMIWGADNDLSPTVNTSLINSLPQDLAFCEGYNVSKRWRVTMPLPATLRTADLKSVKLSLNLSGTGITTTQNANPSVPQSYYLLIDENSDNVYDRYVLASTLTQNGGKDDLITFENVEFDKDNNGADQFSIAWRKDETLATVYSTVGTSNAMVAYCVNNNFRYYRDPSNVSKSYMAIHPSGNTIAPTKVEVKRNAAITSSYISVANGINYQSRLSPILFYVEDNSTYSSGGGALVRLFYNASDINAVNTVFNTRTWFYYPGNPTAFQTAFQTDPRVLTATNLSVVGSGTMFSGVSYVDLRIPSGGVIAYKSYLQTQGLIGETSLYYGTDSFNVITGTHLFAKDATKSFILENPGIVTYSGSQTAEVGKIIYEPSNQRFYVKFATDWYLVDNDTNTEVAPTTNGVQAGQITLYQGHVWGWNGTVWKQMDN